MTWRRRFRKIVVTGDDGRFLVPDLPDADYAVWVRGYGLLDSGKHAARPGDELTLEVTAAATPQEAARIYPANYWYSLLEVPAESEFPGTGADGNGISERMRHQAEWVDRLKDGCQLCHQMGNLATREMPMLNLDDFDSTLDAWEHRVQVGRSGPGMSAGLNRMGRERALGLFADWTDRIAAGEVPPAPPRPQGQERNLVLTMWGWGDTMAMVHDEIATDKRNPHLYPNAPVYGVGGAGLTITDPVTHRSVRMDMTTRDPMPERGDSYAGTTALIPVAVLGHGATDHPGLQRPQPDAGRRGAPLDHPVDPSPRESRLVPGRLGSPVGAELPHLAQPAAALVLRHRERRVRAHRHLLHDPPPAVRRGRERHALAERIDGRGRLAEHEAVRRDRRRAGGPRAGAPPSSTRAGTASSASTPSRASRRIRRRTCGWTASPTGSSRTRSTAPSGSRGALPVPGSIVRLDLGDNPPETCSAEVYEPPFENPDVDPSQWGTRRGAG